MSDLLYWSADQGDAYVRALNESPEFQKATRKFEGRVQFRCLDNPEGDDVVATYTIHRGSVTFDRRAEAAPSSSIRNEAFDKKALFARTTAPYELWVKLDKGEISVVKAITSPDYRVEGPKLKIMANIGLFNAMGSVGSKQHKRYR